MKVLNFLVMINKLEHGGDATLASCVYLAEGPQEPDNILKQFVTLKRKQILDSSFVYDAILWLNTCWDVFIGTICSKKKI